MTKKGEWEKRDIRYKVLEPMSFHTSFKVGGKADLMLWVPGESQLRYTLGFAKKQNIPVMVIGRGTNILVKEQGIKGIVIILSGGFKKKSLINEKPESREIIAGAGTTLAGLGAFALENSLTGMECLSGIPGTLGGAIRINAGAGGQEIGTLVESVRLMNLNGDILEMPGNDIQFGYRYSSLKRGWIILAAKLNMTKGNSRDILKKMREHLQWRKNRQPINCPSAGSVFKNPPGVTAAELIESVGLKGRRMGDAGISAKHSNFIVNLGGAKAKDILALIGLAKAKVLEKKGIAMDLEIEIVG